MVDIGKRTCSIPGCGRPLYARGWCSRCYQRWLHHGDPTVNLAPKGLSAEQRLWASVNKDGPIPGHRPDLGPCWIWTKSLAGRGAARYGRLLDGDRTVAVHRLAYELLVGPIPEDLTLDHLCRVTRCVRPSHLEPVTDLENLRRGLRGELITHCKRGHPFDEVNTYWYVGTNGNWWRNCRICMAMRRGQVTPFSPPTLST